MDRLIVRPSDEFRQRLADSMETAAGESGGLVLVDLFDKGTLLFSQNYACPECGVSIEELSPRMFSFNSPLRGLSRMRRSGHGDAHLPGNRHSQSGLEP